MDITPIDTNNVLSAVTEKNSLVAFQLFAIIALGYVASTLYKRNVKQGDDQAKALVDSTLAINNNTQALQLLTKEIERMNDDR
jgi:hypothetical protein